MTINVPDPRLQPVPTGPGRDPHLSAREREVLITWVKCDSKIEAGNQLFLSIGTVNTHIARIRGKYAAAGRPANTKAALLARALQDGLITPDEL